MSELTAQLPATWLALFLGEVVDYGVAEKVEPHEMAPSTWVLELEDIERDSARVLNRLTFEERRSRSTKNRFCKGDVLYGKLRPYLNKVVHADTPGACTTEIVPIRPNEAVVGRYLFHWLRHPEFLRYVTEASHGVNMPRLGTEAGKMAPFVLAPRQEQQRIADKLDTVLARVDACRDRLARVAPLLKRFRQSVLAAATSGRLTEDFRRTSGSREEWRNATLDSVCRKITDGEHITPPPSASGVPLVSAKDVRDWGIDLTDVKFVSSEFAAAARRRCDPRLGDVLVVSRGATVGRTCMVNTSQPFCLMGSVLLFRPESAVIRSRYLANYLASPYGTELLKQASGATAQAAIYIRDARALSIRVPSLDEQDEIVRRVEVLMAFVERLETNLTKAQTATDRLTPALLAKAFRGELIPQDPNDEPASDLLKRLAASRNEPGKKEQQCRAHARRASR